MIKQQIMIKDRHVHMQEKLLFQMHLCFKKDIVKFKIYDAALETLNEGLKITYNKAFIHYCKGIALQNQQIRSRIFESQQLNEALNSFKIASQFDPNFGLNNFNVGNIQLIVNLFMNFHRYKYIIQSINYIKFKIQFYFILRTQQKLQDALIYMDSAIKSDPNLLKAYTGKSLILPQFGVIQCNYVR